MIWTLFKKECRMLWKSLIFWLYILAVALFFFSQMGTITFEPKPQPEGRKLWHEAFRQTGRPDTRGAW